MLALRKRRELTAGVEAVCKISTNALCHSPKREKSKTGEPLKVKRDWIGPADKDSKIRPIKFYIPDNETANERQFREHREDAQRFNHHFWTKHNKAFFKEKEEFIQKKLREKGTFDVEGNPTKLTPEEMAVFYKTFLDKNYTLHKEYNKMWYKKNIALLWPAFKVQVERLFRGKPD